mmetsp:Transcript_8485/g.14887  ORF Transcript_8485/g.14887 Transcript_8485/m.14887 type:complete len:177 (-) Transcript_8485:1588-2118(-)
MQGLQGGEQIEKTRNISDEYTSVSSHPRRLHIERRPALGHTLVEMSCYMLSKTRMACLVGCLKVLILKSNQLSLKLLFLISSTASSMQMETPPKWREIQFWLTEIHVATDFSRYSIERMASHRCKTKFLLDTQTEIQSYNSFKSLSQLTSEVAALETEAALTRMLAFHILSFNLLV